MEFKVDIQKLIVSGPKDVFDAIDQANKFSRDLLEAYHIIQSAVMFPDDQDHQWHIARMKKFLQKYSIEQSKELSA